MKTVFLNIVVRSILHERDWGDRGTRHEKRQDSL